MNFFYQKKYYDYVKMSIDYLLNILFYFPQIFLLSYKLKIIFKYSIYYYYKL